MSWHKKIMAGSEESINELKGTRLTLTEFIEKLGSPNINGDLYTKGVTVTTGGILHLDDHEVEVKIKSNEDNRHIRWTADLLLSQIGTDRILLVLDKGKVTNAYKYDHETRIFDFTNDLQVRIKNTPRPTIAEFRGDYFFFQQIMNGIFKEYLFEKRTVSSDGILYLGDQAVKVKKKFYENGKGAPWTAAPVFTQIGADWILLVLDNGGVANAFKYNMVKNMFELQNELQARKGSKAPLPTVIEFKEDHAFFQQIAGGHLVEYSFQKKKINSKGIVYLGDHTVQAKRTTDESKKQISGIADLVFSRAGDDWLLLIMDEGKVTNAFKLDLEKNNIDLENDLQARRKSAPLPTAAEFKEDHAFFQGITTGALREYKFKTREVNNQGVIYLGDHAVQVKQKTDKNYRRISWKAVPVYYHFEDKKYISLTDADTGDIRDILEVVSPEEIRSTMRKRRNVHGYSPSHARSTFRYTGIEAEAQGLHGGRYRSETALMDMILEEHGKDIRFGRNNSGLARSLKGKRIGGRSLVEYSDIDLNKIESAPGSLSNVSNHWLRSKLSSVAQVFNSRVHIEKRTPAKNPPQDRVIEDVSQIRYLGNDEVINESNLEKVEVYTTENRSKIRELISDIQNYPGKYELHQEFKDYLDGIKAEWLEQKYARERKALEKYSGVIEKLILAGEYDINTRKNLALLWKVYGTRLNMEKYEEIVTEFKKETDYEVVGKNEMRELLKTPIEELYPRILIMIEDLGQRELKNAIMLAGE
jgi:hypothetical protein